MALGREHNINTNTTARVRSLFGSFALRLAVVGLGMIAAPWASAQLHFQSSIPITPSTHLDGGDYATNYRLTQQSELRLQVMWNSSGGAVIYTTGNDKTGGGFVNEAAGSGVAWEYTYDLKLVRIEDGRYAVAIEWHRKRLTGEVETATKVIGEIKQDEPDQLIPPGQATPSTTTNVTAPSGSVNLNATTGAAGQWYTMSYTYTYAYISWYGSYVVVQRTVSITYWMPNNQGPGGGEILY